MGKGSRDKGAKAERAVADLCQSWWDKLEPRCEFARTPLSGGWQTSSIRGHFKASGDLMTTAEHWPFSVEVKRREGWAIKNLLSGKKSPVWGWWLQTIRQSKEETGVPMLWVRKNQPFPARPRKEWLVIVPQRYVKFTKLQKPDVSWERSTLKENGVSFGGQAYFPCGYWSSSLVSMEPSSLVLGSKTCCLQQLQTQMSTCV